MCFQFPRRWHRWLAHAKWWYNTTYHSSLVMTPYEALYGQPPPTHLVATAEAATVQEVQEWGIERERLTGVLKDRLQVAQNRMKQQADKHRREKEY